MCSMVLRSAASGKPAMNSAVWTPGTVIGCMVRAPLLPVQLSHLLPCGLFQLDMEAREMQFTFNGKSTGIAFQGFETEGLYPGKP